MNRVPTKLPPAHSALERFAELKSHPDFVTYASANRAGRRRPLWFSVHGIWSTGEILVEMTDGRVTRVQAFFTRHLSCPPEDRREAMTLVDAADASELARRMVRNWPRRPKPLPPA